MSPKPPRLGLVLSAGGARAAYQVGVLRHIAEHHPNFAPKVFAGVSAGSINAAFLSQGEPIQDATLKMFQLWDDIDFDLVFNTNFQSLFRMFGRWMYDLFLSKVTRRLLLRSLLDATPLSTTLLTHIQFPKITKAIREGRVHGVAICTTNYHEGSTTIFFDSAEAKDPWIREQRKAIRTHLRVRHIMASCSIPILFEPVPIGNSLYGDGSLRFNFPFSPAIQLGASHVLAIGIRYPHQPLADTDHRSHQLSMGFVAGSVLNSIFLDSLEFDYENMQRINRIAGEGSAKHRPVLLIRPSKDLGKLASHHLDEVPFHLRQLLRATARPQDLGDLLSYLMFSKGYVRELMALGQKDAEAQHDAIAKFLADFDEKKDTQAV